jgi:hypothetical protein
MNRAHVSSDCFIWIKLLKRTDKKLNFMCFDSGSSNPDGSIGQRILEFLSSVSRETPKSPIPLGIIERKENGVAKNSSLLSQEESDLLKSQITQENVARG